MCFLYMCCKRKKNPPVARDQVNICSKIYTDISKVYKKHVKLGFIHKSFAYRYNYFDPVYCVPTPAADNSNNYIKIHKTRRC